jgi:hypothetical protein
MDSQSTHRLPAKGALKREMEMDNLHTAIFEEGNNGDERDAWVMEACRNASDYYDWHDRNRAKAFIGLSEEEVRSVAVGR